MDALWSREPTTVSGNLLIARQGVKVAAALGFKEQFLKPMGPFPIEGTFRIAAAIRNASTIIETWEVCQYNTIWHGEEI